jgi:hypothetical protein
MSGDRAERIESIVDRLAAGLFASAIAYVFFRLMGGVYGEPRLGIITAGAATAAYFLSARMLGSVAPEDRRFDVARFEVAAIEDVHLNELLLAEQVELLLTEQVELVLTNAERVRPAELLLTDADRARPTETRDRGELVLDDILAELGPDSRVVRLFDPAAMPTPAQLNARIERHLGEAGPAVASPDASQALYDALTELRRSLR